MSVSRTGAKHWRVKKYCVCVELPKCGAGRQQLVLLMNVIKPLLILFLLLDTGLLVCAKAVEEKMRAAEAAFSEAEGLRAEQREAASRKAVERYREAATLFESSGDRKRTSAALRNAGEILQLLGNSSESAAYYKRALTLTLKSRDLLQQGRLYNDLAYLHFIAGNSKEAEQNARAALKIARTIRNREIEAEALNNLGEAFYGFGEIAKALEFQQQSLGIWRELNNSRGQAIASIALGYNYQNLGQPEKALRSVAEGLSLAHRANDLAIETVALIAIGHLDRKTGRHQEALESYAAAKIIAERIGDQTSQATILGGMGMVHFEMGDVRQALPYIADATSLMERNGKKWGAGEGKLELGRLHHSLGDEEKALQYFNEAMVLFQSLSMPRLEAAVLRGLGLVYESLGDTSKALEAYEKALKLTPTSEDQREQAYTVNYIGKIYEELKQTDRALKCYREALPLSQRSANRVGEALIRYNLAHLERDRGNLSEARQQVEAALAIVESQRESVSSQDLRTSYFATVRNTYDLYIDVLMRLHKQNQSAGFDREAFAISEKARARSFLELLSEARANVRDGADPALLANERQLSDDINTKAQYQVQLFAEKRRDEAEQVSKELDTLVTRLAEVRDQIRKASPSLASETLPQTLTLDEVQQQLLDDNTVLLEYALGDDRSYVWVVTRTTFFTYELSPRADIEAAATRLRDLIASRQIIYGEPTAARVARQAKVDSEIPAETAAVSKSILAPLAERLDKKRLLVIPDGAVQQIPFQLLTDPSSGDFLIAKHEIMNSPSASILSLVKTRSANRKPAPNAVAVLADPVFEIDDPRVKRNSDRGSENAKGTLAVGQALRDVGVSPDGVQIPRLLASGAEADGIMAVVPWWKGLKAVGFAANRERVLGSELANYRIIHFATHGIINSERPELSGIVLSLFDSEGRSQNGFLRLYDIYNLHLPADLVVLSACSTGLGKDVRGEGLIGLTRGFMYAGASGVIASLWKVDDDATAELMRHFYEAMFNEGMAPAAALRHAQLELAQSERWQSPYYWAGFVIQGQYNDSENFIEPFLSRTQLALLGTLGGLLLLLLIIGRRRRRHV
jgi:CHAT domain-containing protein